jgi:hypothetical protein
MKFPQDLSRENIIPVSARIDFWSRATKNLCGFKPINAWEGLK